MQMAAVGIVNRLSVLNSAQSCAQGVVYGNPQYENWDKDGQYRRALEGASDREACQQIAQEHRAGIAHKDAGGTEVVGQKSQTSSGQRSA